MKFSLLRPTVWILAGFAAAIGIAAMAGLAVADLPGDYVEGVVLAAQEDVRAGRPLYNELNWTAPPYSINLYGPVYYHLGAWTADLLAASPGSLIPGRLLSLASLALALWALWRLQRELMDLDLGSSVLGVILPLGTLPVVVFGAQYRVDVFAIACGLWGLVLAAEGGRRLWLAPVLFVLAVYTKPTAIAAVLALGLWWLLDRRIREIAIVATGCLVLGGLWLAALAWLTDGAFTQSVFGFNALPFSFGGFLAATRQGLGGGLIVVAAGLAAATVLDHRGGERLAGLYLLVALVLALVTVGRMGANFNYFVEASLALGPVVAAAWDRSRRQAGCWLPGVLAAVLAGSLLWTGPRAIREHRARSERALVEGRLEQLIRPGDTVLTMEIVSAVRLGAHPVSNDPFIFSRLAETGAWDQSQLVGDLRSGAVEWILADEDLTSPRSGHTNWTDAVRDATEHYFQPVTTLGRLHLYRNRRHEEIAP